MPSGPSSVKKPLPFIATSRGLPVSFIGPSVNSVYISLVAFISRLSLSSSSRVTDGVSSPSDSCCCESDDTSISLNAMLSFLNPAVFALARLLLIISICFCLITAPESAIYIPLFIMQAPYCLN
ncbi:membrane protein [Candidatus Magnetoovum chiemensis]|nr:membrane protein [Candidatus Magnetoovum chiemensis]